MPPEQRQRSYRNPSFWRFDDVGESAVPLACSSSSSGIQLEIWRLRRPICMNHVLTRQTIQWGLVSCDLHLKRNLIIQNNFVSSCRLLTLKRRSDSGSITEPPLVLFSTRVLQLFPLILHQSSYTYTNCLYIVVLCTAVFTHQVIVPSSNCNEIVRDS